MQIDDRSQLHLLNLHLRVNGHLLAELNSPTHRHLHHTIIFNPSLVEHSTIITLHHTRNCIRICLAPVTARIRVSEKIASIGLEDCAAVFQVCDVVVPILAVKTAVLAIADVRFPEHAVCVAFDDLGGRCGSARAHKTGKDEERNIP